MSNSTVTFDALVQSQASKEITANAYFDAASPATAFGRRQSTTSGTASTTNYVEATRAGVVSKNTTGFTAGAIPLYSVVTDAASVTSYTDYRLQAVPYTGKLAKAMSDANTTLTAAEARNQILEFTGTLTVARNIVLPLGVQQWTVFNNTTGGFGLQFIGASGTGITVSAGKRAIIYADGTNIVRTSADV